MDTIVDTPSITPKQPKLPQSMLWIGLSLILFYVAARLLIFLSSAEFRLWYDSAVFAQVAMGNFWSPDFWHSRQPPTYPLFLKFFRTTPTTLWIGSNLSAFMQALGLTPVFSVGAGPEELARMLLGEFQVVLLAWGQWLLSLLCWLFFGWAASRTMGPNRWWRLAVMATMLLISLEPAVTLWDGNFLSESFSISLLVLLSGLILLRTVYPSRPLTTLLVIILILYSYLRVTNLFFVFGLLFYFVAGYWINRHRSRVELLVLAVVIIGLSAINFASIHQGQRDFVPLRSVISTRVIAPGFAAMADHFNAQGMPTVPKTPLFLGKLWLAPFETLPGMADWIRNSAHQTYRSYLLNNPKYLLFRPFLGGSFANDLPVYRYYSPRLHYYQLPNQLGWRFFFRWQPLVLLAGVVPILLILAYSGPRFGNWEPFPLYPLFLVLGGVILSLIIWHGDPSEGDRHMIQVAVQLRLGLILMLLHSTQRLLANPLRCMHWRDKLPT